MAKWVFQRASSMLSFFPCPSDCLDEIGLGDLFSTREIAGSDLGINFYSGIGRNQVL
jgi:hypothetical protein